MALYPTRNLFIIASFQPQFFIWDIALCINTRFEEWSRRPCHLLSSGILRSVSWQFISDVSGQPSGPIFKGQEMQEKKVSFLLVYLDYSLRRIPEESRSHLLCKGSLKWRTEEHVVRENVSISFDKGDYTFRLSDDAIMSPKIERQFITRKYSANNNELQLQKLPQKHTIRPNRIPLKLVTALFVSTFSLTMWAIQPDIKWLTQKFSLD